MINSIMIVSHYLCNFNCKYCNQREKVSDDKLDYNQVFKFIKWLYKNQKITQNLSIQFEGGETLIRWKDFIKPLVEKIDKELKIKVNYSLFTNGTICTPELIDFLKQYDFTVTLSIDGDKKVFEKQRNAKYFDLVNQNIIKFLKIKKLGVNAVYTPSVINDLEDSYDFFVNKGLKRVSFTPDNGDLTKWTEKELQLITEKFIKILEKDKKNQIIIAQNSLWNSLESEKYKKTKHHSQLRIFPNGKITFGSDPFLKNEIRGENCTLNNYVNTFQSKDNVLNQNYNLVNSIEQCQKCISKFLCPGALEKKENVKKTSPALCAMRVAFLIQERLEND